MGAYLAIDKIVAIAKERHVAVVHPGYGFLSENAEFSRQVEAAGIAFAGPSPEIIDSCGDKTKARMLAMKCNISVVPGSDGPINTSSEAVEFVKTHGLPVIIKAAMGGGGNVNRV